MTGLWMLPKGAKRKPRAPGQKNAHPERNLQIRIATLLSWMLPPEVPWTAIGHGGGGEQRGRILKQMGMKAGFPDIVLIHHGRFIGIELKAAKGSLSPAQRAVHQQIVAAGGVVRVCKSEEDVIDFLDVLGIPRASVRLSPAERAAISSGLSYRPGR